VHRGASCLLRGPVSFHRSGQIGLPVPNRSQLESASIGMPAHTAGRCSGSSCGGRNLAVGIAACLQTHGSGAICALAIRTESEVMTKSVGKDCGRTYGTRMHDLRRRRR
jgi:hypothetical protein